MSEHSSTTKDDYSCPTPEQQALLERQGNWATSWSQVLLSPATDCHLVRHCSFFGPCRIGALQTGQLSRSGLSLPVGLYRSNFDHAIIEGQVAIHEVHYLNRVCVEAEVLLFAIDELSSSADSAFGCGRSGDQSGDYGLELGNENGNRIVYPFPGMRSADAWWWSRQRDNQALLVRFQEMSEQKLKQLSAAAHQDFGSPGPWARIGHHSVIKSCRSIKDCWIGSHSYIKGANKLKNLSILSDEQQPVQIGEGVELVNGIIAGGAKIFYGSKAVRFYCDQNSQLKYGARLLNSYLGANSTVSCCELLNSLLGPAHEQHHNNSFLIAATIGGQSNIAAAATLGSNHNSRAADGELVAERGFWPALNTSLKYNCRLAAFSLLSSAHYPAALQIPYPFSLLGYQNDRLYLQPAYWFRHNIYALERNSWKFAQRDQRHCPQQFYHYHYLEADTAAQISTALQMLRQQLDRPRPLLVDGLIKGKKTLIHKPDEAISDYQKMLLYYVARSLLDWTQQHAGTLAELEQRPLYQQWLNCGGQIMPRTRLKNLEQQILAGRVRSWDEVHDNYQQIQQHYSSDNARFALYLGGQLLPELGNSWPALFRQAAAVASWIFTAAADKRRQDFDDPFRQSCYLNAAEQQAVLGELDHDCFLNELRQRQQAYAEQFNSLAQRTPL